MRNADKAVGIEFTPEYAAGFIEKAIRDRVFPGAVVVWGSLATEPDLIAVGRQGISRDQRPVHPDLVYDLASVTKVVSTTGLMIIMTGRGLVDLMEPLVGGPLGPLLPSSFDLRITPLHLLAHQSGLPPWRPFYRLEVPAGHHDRWADVCAALPESLGPPGRETVYSDLNFILLGFLLEKITGIPQDELFQREIAAPLGLDRTGYRPRIRDIAPTEDGFRWGGPIGDPSTLFRGPVPLGRVHDDNAAFLGGVAGHAGLFGTAKEIWRVVREWNRGLAGDGGLFQPEVIADFIRPRPTKKDEGRPLGFNIRRTVKSMAETRVPPEAVGHLGYTGPSVWWDAQSGTALIFLTNRVHPRTNNPAWQPGYYQGMGRCS